MSIRYKIILLLVLLIFLFPADVKAGEKYNIYVFEYTKDSLRLIPRQVETNDNGTDLENLYFLIENLLNYEGNMVKYIPEEAKLEGAFINNESAYIFFDGGMNNYGGCFYERVMLYELLKTVFEIRSIEYVSLYVKDDENCFREGSGIRNFSREQLWDMEYDFILKNGM